MRGRYCLHKVLSQKIEEKKMDTDQARSFFAADRFAAEAGITIVEAGTGYCRAMMAIDKRHLNAAGVVQGGAIFTLADLAFAVASNSRGQLALAISANIFFLAAKSHGTLYAAASEVGEPKRIGTYDVLVTDEEGEVVARFTGMVYRKRQNLSF